MSPAQDDRQSVEAVVDAVYAAISGPVGQPRDWDAMRRLFLPDARMMALRVAGPWSGGVEDYVANSGDFLVERGFAEATMVNRSAIYGDIAHVWSSYSGGWSEEDGSRGATRGINSFQLIRQQDGSWRVHSLLWQAETPAIAMPADMEAPR